MTAAPLPLFLLIRCVSLGVKGSFQISNRIVLFWGTKKSLCTKSGGCWYSSSFYKREELRIGIRLLLVPQRKDTF